MFVVLLLLMFSFNPFNSQTLWRSLPSKLYIKATCRIQCDFKISDIQKPGFLPFFDFALPDELEIEYAKVLGSNLASDSCWKIQISFFGWRKFKTVLNAQSTNESTNTSAGTTAVSPFGDMIRTLLYGMNKVKSMNGPTSKIKIKILWEIICRI